MAVCGFSGSSKKTSDRTGSLETVFETRFDDVQEAWMQQVRHVFLRNFQLQRDAIVIDMASTLAFIGGAAATLQKIANPDFVVKSVALEIIKDIFSSVVAGLITYSVCAWIGCPLLLQPACITIAGYGGSRVLERYLSAGMARIDRLGGKPEGTP